MNTVIHFTFLNAEIIVWGWFQLGFSRFRTSMADLHLGGWGHHDSGHCCLLSSVHVFSRERLHYLLPHTYLKALCLGLLWDLGELLCCQLWFLSCVAFCARYLWPFFLTLQFSTRVLVVRRQHVRDVPHGQQRSPTPRRAQRGQPGRRASGARRKPGSASLASGARVQAGLAARSQQTVLKGAGGTWGIRAVCTRLSP